jgi:hypothetical protein
VITPNFRPDAKQLRQFAWIALPGFCLFGWLALRWTGSTNLALGLAAFGTFLAVLGSFVPRAVLPVYLAMMALAFPVGLVVSELILRVIYYGVFTPLALVFRAIRRDPLQLRKPQTDSYWTRRRQRTDPLAYFRQA